MKQGNAVFAFTLKNKAGETESWHIDLKNKGEVGKGLGDKPTGKSSFSLSRGRDGEGPAQQRRFRSSIIQLSRVHD
jgi:hypothetical protein